MPTPRTKYGEVHELLGWVATPIRDFIPHGSGMLKPCSKQPLSMLGGVSVVDTSAGHV